MEEIKGNYRIGNIVKAVSKNEATATKWMWSTAKHWNTTTTCHHESNDNGQWWNKKLKMAQICSALNTTTTCHH